MLTFEKEEKRQLLFALLQISGPAVGRLPSGPQMWSVRYVHGASLPASSRRTAPGMARPLPSAFALPRGATWFLSEAKLMLLSEDRWTRGSAPSAHPLI